MTGDELRNLPGLTPTDHELTIEIGPDLYQPELWRLVGTCSCLHFARTLVSAHPAAGQLGALAIERDHQVHQRRMPLSYYAPHDRPEWLP